MIERAPGDPSEIGDAYERAACGLLTINAEGAIVRVSATMCAYTGFAAPELVGRTFQSLLTMGSKLFHQTHWSPLLELQGSVAEVQLELKHRDGRVLPVLVNAARRAAVPGVRTLVDIAVFVASDRRKYERELLLARKRAEDLLFRAREADAARAVAEARLRLALESANLRVWSAELPGGVRRYERGVAVLLGRPELEEITAATYAGHMHPDDRARDEAAVAAALDPSVRAAYSIEYPLVGADGVERFVRSTGQAFFDDDGQPVQFSGVLEDITDRRRAEEALRHQQAEAQQRAILAEQLIGIVSHDLRNPLNAVMLGAELLGDLDSGDNAPVIRRITASAARANRLIADLLDFTQARLGGGLRVARRPIDIHAVVADCLEEVKMAWPGRAIEHRRLGEGEGRGDADRLAQVVTNLVTNALVYGTPTEPVTVTSVIAEATLELQVHNLGPPIPAALRPQMFEPLRRGDQEAKLGSRSVGLGLYIVREIAVAHGGHIALRSTAEEGTTFVLTVPRG
ncbi:MAG: ATP-binding protein [Byssovorax sp.]